MKVLTVDIDGTYIRYACMDEYMNIAQRGKIFTPQEGREVLIEAVARLFEAVGDAEGIAISMPGIIDSEKGYCAMGGALRYNDDFYFRDALYERCNTKIHIENNAKCAAMAEATVGSLMDDEDGFVLIFSTMIGGGYIKDHTLHRGTHFSAGEVSYITSDRDGTPNFEGVFGNRCGTPRLCKMYADAKSLPANEVDGVVVFNAVNSGDETAKACLDKFAKEIAVQIFNLQTVLDPQRFAIGGGISAQPAFIEAIKENLKGLYAQCPYYVPQAEIVTCKFQNDANLIGAVQCFLAQDNI